MNILFLAFIEISELIQFGFAGICIAVLVKLLFNQTKKNEILNEKYISLQEKTIAALTLSTEVIKENSELLQKLPQKELGHEKSE